MSTYFIILSFSQAKKKKENHIIMTINIAQRSPSPRLSLKFEFEFEFSSININKLFSTYHHSARRINLVVKEHLFVRSSLFLYRICENKLERSLAVLLLSSMSPWSTAHEVAPKTPKTPTMVNLDVTKRINNKL